MYQLSFFKKTHNGKIQIAFSLQDAGFNVNIADKSQAMGMLSLQGPRARQILEK